MRHGKKINHLSRTASHRSAMLSNMASSLIMEKRISTTVAKAKALRKYVEPLLTKSKDDSTHSRRVVFSYLQNKESVSELFNNVAEKIATRPGGYTRILKTGNRLGDNADMCIIELVDYNEALLKEAKPAKSKTRRSRRGKGGAAATEATAPETTVVEETPLVEETKAEEAAADEAVEETAEAVVEEAEVVEEAAEVVEEAAEVTEEVVEEAVEEVKASAEETAEEPEAEEVAAEETTDEAAPEEPTESDDEEPKKE